jgi:hypothetical protein
VIKSFTAALIGAACLLTAVQAHADEAAACRAADGSFLTGRVTAGPNFVAGHEKRGVELSHTHVTLLADQDGNTYDVAMDDVFAAGYDAAGESVPAPLSGIAVGTRLALCGALYSSGGFGIHWVHTDCGQAPAPGQPDGWVIILDAAGLAGPNLEDSQEYCGLWP